MLFIVHMQRGFEDRIDKATLKHVLSLAEEHETWHFTAEEDLFDNLLQEHEIISKLIPHIDVEVEWSWGYHPESFPEEEKEWVIESVYSHHEYTWIPEELREWKSKETIILVGGIAGSCLGSMESILDHLDIPYQLDYQGIYR